ncbi:hypothetical protein, partial [Bradyrhizobium sp.]|uniref:hypothetical protein n=1 Tax=Bradyrhizobium sp. TaxID=376 RepID=UPI0027349E39
PARGFAEGAAAHSMQMVNGEFPEPASYGFERVDATGGCGLPPESVINRKFTPNRMSRIFR